MLDLCCGEGGASAGYVQAGFEVVGVDINPMPRYPYRFVEADALRILADEAFVAGFDFIHASFPCQAFLKGTLAPARHVPDLFPNPVTGVGPLRTIRHRLFEPSKHFDLVAPPHPKHTRRTAHKRRREMWDRGYHASITGDIGTYVGPEAMGISWMSGNGLSEAIPPAYARFVGAQVLAYLNGAAARGAQPDLFEVSGVAS